jgi:hypothetical protein
MPREKNVQCKTAMPATNGLEDRTVPSSKSIATRARSHRGIMRRSMCMWFGLLLTLGGLSTLGSSDSAQAADVPSSTVLPGTFSSMAVDPVDDLVFVSTPGDGSVEVLNFSGNIIDTISGFGHNASDAANSIIYADGSIYMTDTTSGTVDRIDPSTLSVEALASGFDLPLDLVYSAGLLWTTSGGSWPPPTLESIDISTGLTTGYGVQLDGAGLVSGGAGLPDTIFSYNIGDSPLSINSIDVQSTATAEVSQDEDGLDGTPVISNVNDVAISPDGSHLVPAGGSPYQFDEFNTSDLEPSGTIYPGNPYPVAVAMTSANGGLLAGGLSGV